MSLAAASRETDLVVEHALGDDLFVRSYPDLSVLEAEGRMAEYVRLQRYIWGHSGVCEYAVCDRDDCRALVSLEEAFAGSASNGPVCRSAEAPVRSDSNGGRSQWLPYAEFELEGPMLSSCPVPSCDGQTELYLEPQLLEIHLQRYCSSASGVLLLDGENRLLGFGDASVGPLSAVTEAVNYRGGYETTEVVSAVQEVVSLGGDFPVLSLNKLAILPSCRRKGAFRSLMSRLIDVTLETSGVDSTSLPVVGDTRHDSRIWAHLHATGFRDLAEDRFGWVVTAARDIRAFRQAMESSSEEFAVLEPELKRAKRLGREHQARRAGQGARRHYTGALQLEQVVG